MTPATDGPMQLANRLNPLAQPVVVVAPGESAGARLFYSARLAIAVLAALAIGLRLMALVLPRGLWIDESMLALNLVERSPRQLLEPLDWNQGAPVGFLLLAKSSLLLLGVAEWSLRLVPFLGSALGVAGFAWLARRILPPGTAILAMALFAVSPFLISYAGECKQYATDSALTIAMFVTAIGLLHGAGGFRRWAVLAASGAAAVWFSHPVAFVLGGVGTALFLDAVVNRDRRRSMACAAAIACWVASFGVCYLVSLRQLGNNQYLLDYWASHFLPLPPTGQGDVLWLADHFFTFLAYPGGLGGTEFKIGGIAAAFCLIGLVAMARERWQMAVALAGPAVLALLASGLHKYPFAGRLLLFLVPLMLLTVARGAIAVASALRPAQTFAAVLLTGLLVLAPTIETYQNFRHPPRAEELAPLISTLRDQWQPGDKVYVYYGAAPGFTFYTRENPLPGGVVFGKEHRGERTPYRDELARLAGSGRVWIVFSHTYQSEESLIRAYAEGLGVCKKVLHAPGAAVYLFDFRGQD